MTQLKMYKEGFDPFVIDLMLDQLTLPEKLHYCKKMLSLLDAIKVEFWHSGSRYTVSFSVTDTK